MVIQMKKLISLLIVFSMFVSLSGGVFADEENTEIKENILETIEDLEDEFDELNDILEPEIMEDEDTTADAEEHDKEDENYERMLSRYLRHMDDDIQKKQKFLDLVAEKAAQGIEINDITLLNILDEVMKIDLEKVTYIQGDANFFEEDDTEYTVCRTKAEKEIIMERNRHLAESGIFEQRLHQNTKSFTNDAIMPNALNVIDFQEVKMPNTKLPEEIFAMQNSSYRIPGRVSKAPMVDSGYSHNVYLKPDGTVWTWGEYYYASGNPTSNDYNIAPVKVGGLNSIIEVAAGGGHSLALTSDGNVYAWGGNMDGQLGDGTHIDRDEPILVEDLSSIIAISAGDHHSIALKSDGTVYAWGNNAEGQLGDNSTASRTVPVQVCISASIHLTGIIAISAGGSHNLALDLDGRVYAWGDNYYGQIGNDSTVQSKVAVLVKDFSGINNINEITAISAGKEHSLALLSNGTVAAWGNNFDGQLGNSTIMSANVPIEVKKANDELLTNIKTICAGDAHSFAISSTNQTFSWGLNYYGQLGTNSQGSREPIEPTLISDITSISTGYFHSVAIKSDGSIWAVGLNQFSQLGNGNRPYSRLLQEAYLPHSIIEIASGSSHNLGLDIDGTVWAWGINYFGQLGNNTFNGSSIPSKVKNTAGNGVLSNIIEIAAGKEHSLALTKDGKVWAWGANLFGQVGISDTYTLTPSLVKFSDGSELTDVISISAGFTHSIALKKDGTVWAWGDNSFMQLGNSIQYSSAQPIQITGLPVIKAISAGDYYNLALTEDGEVWAWGDNSDKQLGALISANTYGPVQVKDISGIENLTNVSSIAASEYSSLALLNNGTVVTWGRTHYRSSNDSSLSLYPIPVQIAGENENDILSDIKSISASWYNNTAITNTGEVWIWGGEQFGLFGKDVKIISVPIKLKNNNGIGNVSNIKSVSQGYGHFLLLKYDGSILAQGYNHSGQLGDGVTQIEYYNWIRTMTPSSSIIQTSSKLYHSLVLKSDGTVWAAGSNQYGKLGIGNDDSNAVAFSPVQVKGEDGIEFLTNVISVSAGESCSYALKNDGTVWAWGYNSSGQLGDGTRINRSTPVQVVGVNNIGYLSEIIEISGGGFCMALKSDGTVYTWGSNYYNQLGNGTSTNSDIPVQVKINEIDYLNDIKMISAGDYFCSVLKSDGTIYSWGMNSEGQLGDGTTINRSYPVLTGENVLSDIISVSAGGWSTCMALKRDGTVWGWGYSGMYTLGCGYNQQPIECTTPIQIVGYNDQPLTDVQSVINSTMYTLVIKNDGTVWAWGIVYGLMIYDGLYYSTESNPIQIKETSSTYLTDVVSASTGSFNNFLIKGDGTLLAFGHNDSGLFGIGNNDWQIYPIKAYTSLKFDDYGNEFETATEFNPGQSVSGEINYDGDVDCFKFKAVISGTAKVKTDSNAKITVYYDNEIISSIGKETTFPIIAGETYYLKVTADKLCDYTFNIGFASTGTQSYHNLSSKNSDFRPYDCYPELTFEDNLPSYWYAEGDIIKLVKNDPQRSAHDGAGAMYLKNNTGMGTMSVWGGPSQGGIQPRIGDTISGYFYYKKLSATGNSGLPKIRLYNTLEGNTEESYFCVTEDFISSDVANAPLNEWIRIEIQSTGKVVTPENVNHIEYNITEGGTEFEYMIDDVVFGGYRSSIKQYSEYEYLNFDLNFDWPTFYPSTWSGEGAVVGFKDSDPDYKPYSGNGVMYVNSTPNIPTAYYSVWGGPYGLGQNAPQVGDIAGGYFYIKKLRESSGYLPHVRFYTGENEPSNYYCITEHSVRMEDLPLNEWIKVDLVSTGKSIIPGDIQFNITSDQTGHEFLIDDITFGSINYSYNLPDTWTTYPGVLSKEAAGKTLTVYNDKVYIIGGLTEDKDNIVKIYDINNNKWYNGSPMPTPVYSHSTTLHNGKLYVIGGYQLSSDVCDKVQIYDIASDTWTYKTEIPEVVADHTATLYRGKIYIIGGNSTIKSTAAVYIYDIAGDTWESGNNMRVGVSGHNTMLYNYRFYITGGEINGVPVNEFQEYHPSYWWYYCPPMPNAVSGHNVIYNQKKFYVIGGKSGNLQKSNIIQIYNDDSSSWSTSSMSPISLEGANAVYFNGKIYIFKDKENCIIYDIFSDTWSKSYAGIQRLYSMPILYNDNIYLIGTSGVKIYGKTKKEVEYENFININYAENPELYKALIKARETLDSNKDGIISVSELKGITGTLNLSNSNISSIDGLQACTSITELYIDNNKIIDLDPISNLNNLTCLLANNNEISSLNQFPYSIEMLNLERNNINDIDQFELNNMSNLEKLFLGHNNIQNIDALKICNELKVLGLEYNDISDISSLSDLYKVECLNLSNNKIKSVENISTLTRLTDLRLSNNFITNIENLPQRVYRFLYVDGNSIPLMQIEQFIAFNKYF